MKLPIKLPITEKFLWDLYDMIEEIDSFGPSFPTSINEAVCPDLKEVRISYNKKRNRWLFKNFISYLKKKGYIRIKELEDKKAVILTPKGLTKLQAIGQKIKIGKKRKDGKWQMVIFDIPETKRLIRDQFRRDLKSLGYQGFQKSIWICPNDVLKETQNLIRKFAIEECVRLLLVEEIVVS